MPKNASFLPVLSESRTRKWLSLLHKGLWFVKQILQRLYILRSHHCALAGCLAQTIQFGDDWFQLRYLLLPILPVTEHPHRPICILARVVMAHELENIGRYILDRLFHFMPALCCVCLRPPLRVRLLEFGGYRSLLLFELCLNSFAKCRHVLGW